MWLVVGLYLLCLLVLAGFGCHMLSLYVRAKLRRPQQDEDRPRASGLPPTPPRVTVQIPVCNEGTDVAHTIHSICALQYPKDRLEIQICDDSTDADTIETCRRLVERYRGTGTNVHHLRRSTRTGFKAGNLNHAMRSANGEFVAVFDADFEAPADFLIHNLPQLLVAPELGLLQTYWRHRNADRSPLHQAIEGSYEIHLLMEQQTWSDWDLWMHSNGSACIWRREALNDCGEWLEGSGVEDLHMSYLAQLKGWNVRFSTATTCTAKLPDTLAAFRGQQRRWALGCGKLLRSLWVPLLTSRARLACRQQAWAKLTGDLTHVAMAAVLWLTWPVVRWSRHHPAQDWLEGVTLALFALLVAGNVLVYAEASRRAGHGLWRRQWRGFLVSMEQAGIASMVGAQYLKGLFGGGLHHWRTSNAQGRPRGFWTDWLLEWGAFACASMAVVDAVRWGSYGLALPAVVFAAGIPFVQIAPLWTTGPARLRDATERPAPR